MQHPSEFIRILMNPQNFTPKNIIRLNPQYVFFGQKDPAQLSAWRPGHMAASSTWPSSSVASSAASRPPVSRASWTRRQPRSLRDQAQTWPVALRAPQWCHASWCWILWFASGFWCWIFYDVLGSHSFWPPEANDLLIAWDGHHWNFTWIKLGLKWTSSVPCLRITG